MGPIYVYNPSALTTTTTSTTESTTTTTTQPETQPTTAATHPQNPSTTHAQIQTQPPVTTSSFSITTTFRPNYQEQPTTTTQAQGGRPWNGDDEDEGKKTNLLFEYIEIHDSSNVVFCYFRRTASNPIHRLRPPSAPFKTVNSHQHFCHIFSNHFPTNTMTSFNV